MENIKKQSIKGYILLESLIALSLLAVITAVILGQISSSHKAINNYNRHIETLNTANMALSVAKNALSANGVTVQLTETNQTFSVSADGKEQLHLEIQAFKN